MPIDKSWINKPQTSIEYLEGLKKFIKFAFERKAIEDKITCPCPSCGFRRLQTENVVFDHLICKPFPKNYKTWVLHGESNEEVLIDASSSSPLIQEATIPQDSMVDMINDAFPFYMPHSNEPNALNEEAIGDGVFNEMPNDATHIQELLKDGSQELYEGCKKYTKLSFIVKLYHIKCLCRISDKAMTMIIELLRDAFEVAKLPLSFYEAKKTINKLGLNFKRIHACPNDCMLYWDGTGDEEKQFCTRCKASRWKDVGKKKPAKILRYFPLKPRLQRLFMCSKTAESMSWHKLEGNRDGLMRHPKDSEAWKKFDLTHPEFASDPRHVRLGLATDGFNPFGVMSTNYSIWPVILIPYNRPPWECMKKTSFILSMIIPGKKMPGNDIDVYLQPLVKELKELWCDGVPTFDSSKNEMFRMRAALMWTISDFPGLGTLSGWNTYTGYACPTCNFDTIPCRLTHGKKYCFMGHRRFLSRGHKFRLNKGCFDGHVEERDPPIVLSGLDILKQVEGMEVIFGKQPELELGEKRPRGKCQQHQSNQWRKKSIFFDLPYWSSNLLRHNLDFMHIEKNVCDNLIYTLLNDSKTKDDLNARRDLMEMGIRRDLWPNENGKCCPAVFTIPNKKKDPFFNTLKNIKVPYGYSSNISRCFDQKKISALKSHDCHILMEQLLPLAVRNVWPDNVTAVVVELCSFFRQLCGKSLNISELDKLQQRIVVTLCHLEMIFPPSFFTVMVHLTCHLVAEAKLGGPVHYRWMYPIER